MPADRRAGGAPPAHARWRGRLPAVAPRAARSAVWRGGLPVHVARARLAPAFRQVELFSRAVLRRPLRGYQVEVARAIARSVLEGRGETYAVLMARQAGKNETSAHLEAYLLTLFRRRGGQLVKAAPTFRPQALNSMQRLVAVLAGSSLPRPRAEHGYMLRVGQARALFLSAAPQANVVGATASILLEADEAQAIDEVKWNKDLIPMASANNATIVLWGTAWTSNTLLAQAVRRLQWAEQRDGQRRVFRVDWERVAAESPAYGRFVRGEIERLGRQHPLIRTQYCLEEIDDAAGLFPAAVRALMQGSHLRQRQPVEGRTYALLVDVAGPAEDPLAEATLLGRPLAEGTRRDRTALTVVEIAAPAEGSDQVGGLPRYLVMDRYVWQGVPHPDLCGAIAQLADLWQAQRVVVDATGVGAGLTSYLQRMLGRYPQGRVQAFTFTVASKSDLGWGYLGICTSGRFLDHRDDGSPEYRQFWREVVAAGYALLDGPSRRMRWGVADPAIHDDLLISAALCAALEDQAAVAYAGSAVVEAADPLGEARRRPR